ncbi:hypothetical protein B0H67DRAFT_495255 [Lasiosphaeris hirsuta]|uniref:Potassium channel domain-containing protein n=1 Tax=Lasiosphaeris hirsuta TaxID=260670 RepID=A0AA40A2S2_9PEZI|nr:hypothetical protein B0H67DRAFT_495255 [Lasiosphaeris hirsuta]
MNDASGERIEDHARAIEPGGKKLPDSSEPIHPHLDPSRWWFASSAFPMIAGTLGPVASAFSICALVKPWRQYYPPGTDVRTAEFIVDPPWLTAINAVQLVIAIAANLALLLNMTRRLRFSIAQPVTIVGWYVSALTLIALTATASGPLIMQPADEYIWSQAFYYGIYSAVLYFVVASLMVVTFMGAQTEHYPKDFILTPSQRTLMLQTISFLMYLLVGALVFSRIEGWNYLDAVYWAAVTLFTVGFGDFHATTTLGRALLLPYALIGIISLGLVIGSIRSLVLERGRHRLDARMVEKKRRQMLRHMTSKGNDEILVPVRDRPVNGEPPGLPSLLSNGSGLTEFERRGEEFKLMRKIQEDAARRRRWLAMAVSSSTWLVLWMAGARIFLSFEQPYQPWSYFDAFYFAFVSLTTIGYGDITPISNGGKSFWVFWALLALPTMTVLISNAGDTIVKWVRDATDQIATVTILPGERGFRKDLKQFLRMLSFGTLFEEDIEEAVPGFLGNAQPHDSTEEEDEDEDYIEGTLKQDENELAAEVEENTASEPTKEQSKKAISFDDHASTGPGSSPGKSRNSLRPNSPSSSSQLLKMTRAVSIPRQILPDIPSNAADYHVTLVEEIGRVTQHIKCHPPRKYTFNEWAWYLRLIGEDEGDADRHRRALPHSHQRRHRHRGEGGRHEGKEKDEEGEGSGTPWSWVGSRSPLMDSQEEAEWILERLTQKLTEELRGVRRAEQSLRKKSIFGRKDHG